MLRSDTFDNWDDDSILSVEGYVLSFTFLMDVRILGIRQSVAVTRHAVV